MNRKKIISSLLILILILSLITACSNIEDLETNTGKEEQVRDKQVEKEEELEYGIDIKDNSVTFVDGRDKEVSIRKHPERTIVLFDSYLEVWCKSGGTVVGRLEAPPEIIVKEAKEAEVIGKLGAINVEKVLSLEPDLVILNSNQKHQMELVPILKENGIEIVALNYFIKDDYFKMVRLFTALNDREDLYEEYGIKVREGIEEVIEKAPKDKSYKILVMMASAKSITVRELASYGRYPHLKFGQRLGKRDYEIVEWAIEKTRLKKFKDRYIMTLSGGEQQRAWLAMSLAQKPEILLLDEPTTFLDISYQLEILELVKELNETLNLTVLMVLHDLNQAARFSDNILVLKDGQIWEYNNPNSILKKELLKEVFRVEGHIYRDEINHCPYFIPYKVN